MKSSLMLVVGENLSSPCPLQDNVSLKSKSCTSVTSCQVMETLMSIKNDGHYSCDPKRAGQAV
jgi:hypothetical protein